MVGPREGLGQSVSLRPSAPAWSGDHGVPPTRPVRPSPRSTRRTRSSRRADRASPRNLDRYARHAGLGHSDQPHSLRHSAAESPSRDRGEPGRHRVACSATGPSPRPALPGPPGGHPTRRRSRRRHRPLAPAPRAPGPGQQSPRKRSSPSAMRSSGRTSRGRGMCPALVAPRCSVPAMLVSSTGPDLDRQKARWSRAGPSRQGGTGRSGRIVVPPGGVDARRCCPAGDVRLGAGGGPMP